MAAIMVLPLATTPAPDANGRLLKIQKKSIEEAAEDNRIVHRCLAPDRYDAGSDGLERKHPWSLPKQALADDYRDTINVLVLRFNFLKEEPKDDPNTTGRGHMNMANPRVDPIDSAAYFDSVGHWIDPPPHDSLYFDAHMQALNRYWETVSEGRISLAWKIFPPVRDSAYQLPHSMSYYGKCEFDSVVFGLEQFFIDCIQLADTDSEIVFSKYESIFLFHAGSDRQNDKGLPETCSDLFTGFIRYYTDPDRGRDTLWVDNRADTVWTALILPETSCQDNRATALNAVIAHEFGHHLGLVDLYSTRTFMSQLGDFALMDNNGFGTGIDFVGFTVGRVFGAVPLYPSAWSRAYLGYVEVHDFRQGSDIHVVAAEVLSEGIKVARVPISENEYYLLENRLVEVTGLVTGVRAPDPTGVIQGPADTLTREYTSEYDLLMPGSGLLIFHVDEGVLRLDYDGDGMDNFDDNDVQWDPDRRFIRLVEADGLVHFGGSYRVGFGRAEDMFRDDRNNEFTPTTNPPAIDNSGNNTRIRITNIARDTDTVVGLPVVLDSVILFDLETDGLADSFPVRAGLPIYGFSPLADDIDGDGTDEIIVVAGRDLLVLTTTGDNFLRQYTGCDTCDIYYDTSSASVYPTPGRPHPLPTYARVGDTISAAPVTGDFGSGVRYIAVGYPTDPSNGRVELFQPVDADADGQADTVSTFPTSGAPIALSFGDILWVLTDRGMVYRKTGLEIPPSPVFSTDDDEFHGLCRIGPDLILMAGDATQTKLYYIDGVTADVDSFSLNDYYSFGPIVVDIDRDSLKEVAAFSPEGRAILVTVDINGAAPSFSILREKETGFPVTTNPIAADINGDGYPDIISGGTNAIYAFNYELTLMTDFPLEVNDRFPEDHVAAPPITADIRGGAPPEIIFPTFVGNVYSFGLEMSYGFPLSGGEQVRGSDSTGRTGGYFGAGSPVVFSDSTGGKLGYLGADGWFYAWDVLTDTTTDYWPMGGHDPEGTFAFDQSKLSNPKAYADLFPRERFYNYPNPVTNGQTKIRYFLGQDARRVQVRIFDLSGLEIAALTGGGTTGGMDHDDLVWNCSDVTPGVYRCMIEVDFGGRIETAFTDIAIIR